MSVPKTLNRQFYEHTNDLGRELFKVAIYILHKISFAKDFNMFY